MSKKKGNARGNHSKDEQLMRDLKSCMHCKHFWGRSNRCANGNCCKDETKKEEIKLPDKCVNCPYNNGNGYCFPCMKELLGK